MRASLTSPPPILSRVALCAVLVVPLASCTKNKPGTNVTIADGDSEHGAGAGGGAKPGDKPDIPRGPIEKIHVSASAVEVGDMLDAASKLVNMWSPPEPGATPVDLRSFIAVMLVQQGFGPGFFESLDLDGVFAAQVGFPHDGQPGVTERDIDVALSLAAINPVRAIESMPAGMQPQPLGDNVWQLVEDDMELLFRAGQNAVEIGLSMELLDVARSLPPGVPVGPKQPRIRVAASNLPSVNIDVSELMPLPPALARSLSEIINEAKSVEAVADFGNDRDLIGRIQANAPFGRLGLDPIGPPMQQPSDLARALPGHAMFVWVMPWGDPKLLHSVIDKQIPVNQIPAPFDGYVGEVLAGTHAVLDTVKDEVLASAYVDKGKVTLVLGAEVKDENAARNSMRKIMTAIEKALKDHIALAGNSPEHKYSVSYKTDAIKLGKAKGDLLTITLPKDMHDEAKDMVWFVGDKKPQLEVAMVVADGKLFVAIGAGQKALMSQVGKRIGKSPDDGLEAGGGLALARSLAEGCQYCVALDPVELGEMVFTILANDSSEPAEVHAAAKKAMTSLPKLGLTGELALALRLEQASGVLGFGWPKALLFADPAKIKSVLDMFESVEDARSKAWEAEVPSGAVR